MSDTAKPDAQADDAGTPGGLPQESVDDRPDIAPVKPEDYPAPDRAKGG
jgi:hypothetical protein